MSRRGWRAAYASGDDVPAVAPPGASHAARLRIAGAALAVGEVIGGVAVGVTTFGPEIMGGALMVGCIAGGLAFGLVTWWVFSAAAYMLTRLDAMPQTDGGSR